MRCLLFFPKQRFTQWRCDCGFTLVELITVIALLAIIASAALMNYDGVQDQARSDVTQFEMTEIRKALLQFRQDSGSRDFPNEGVYSCEDPNNAGSLNPALLNIPTAANLAWCQSEANFWMLFVNPFNDDWNPDTRRGWNGPYLQTKNQAVSFSGINDLHGILSPDGEPYLLVNIDADNISIVSAGANDLVGTITDCGSDDADDHVLCLLQ